MSKIERWLPVVGYEGHYSVSTFGRVYSHKTNKVLKQALSSRKYACVNLSKNNKRKTHNVHRLVLAAFVGTSDKETDHINGDKLNNHLDNLEYVSSSENTIRWYKQRNNYV